jgi:transcriptional regulator with XRE-family HTH domain
MMCYIPAVRTPRSLRKKASSTDVSALIKRIRVARKLTQEGLAREMGVTFSTVNGWENGRHRPIPSLISKLNDIASAAGLAISEGRIVLHDRVRLQTGREQ